METQGEKHGLTARSGVPCRFLGQQPNPNGQATGRESVRRGHTRIAAAGCVRVCFLAMLKDADTVPTFHRVTVKGAGSQAS